MNRTTLALAFLAVLAGAPRALGAVEYIFTDLGTLGGTESRADGINAAGQIVGQSKITGGTSSNAFCTAANSPINPATDDLGTLDSAWANAWAINASGQIAGESQVPGGNYRAFRTEAGVPLDPALHDMGTFGGDSGFAKDINDVGQVVGSAQTAGGVYHAFRTAGNVLDPNTDDLGTLGGTRSLGNGINAIGQVTGAAWLPGDTLRHAFRTAPNSAINPVTDDLGSLIPDTFYDAFSIGKDINDSGQVAGYARTADGYSHAFCTAPNSPIDPATDDLGTLGGHKSVANAINTSGLVVGWSDIPSGASWHAFLYRDSEMLDLNDLVDLPDGWTLIYAADINDAGQIVGLATVNIHQERAYLLTLIPEPCTLVLLCTGLAFCPRRRRRKATEK